MKQKSIWNGAGAVIRRGIGFLTAAVLLCGTAACLPGCGGAEGENLVSGTETAAPETTAAQTAERTEDKMDCYEDKKYPGIPIYSGTATVYRGGEADGFVICDTDSDEESFSAYARKLEDAGFTQVQQREKVCGFTAPTRECKNVYLTYLREDTAVYMYYIGKSENVRIAVTGSAAYQALLDCEKDEGQGTGTAPSEMAFMDIGSGADVPSQYRASGLSMAFRLSDGRFIVVDGGIWYQGDTAASDVTRLYEWLKAEAGGKEPVIAAWLFTHEHVDHVNAAWKFEQMYGDRVQIRRYVLNFVDYTYALSFPGTDLKRGTYDTIIPRMQSMLAKYPNVTVHTGQVLHIGNAEIEVLYTHEDYYPRELTIFNNSSTVYRVTVDGTSFLIGGDAQEGAQGIIVNCNGNTLASDFVVGTHHGYNASVVYYQYGTKAGKTVALWPNMNTVPGSDANTWLNANVSASFDQRGGILTFPLPYQPGN